MAAGQGERTHPTLMWNSRFNMSDSHAPFHIGAWLLWLLAAMLGALLTRNPYYLSIVLLASWLVSLRLGRGRAPGDGESADRTTALPQANPTGRGWGLFMRAVLVLLLLVTLFKALSLHLGTTVLFRLPEEWPLVGGPTTAEGLAYAALDALSLLTIISVFAAFSAGADYYALLRSVPAAMHQVGLVTSIAITFVPQTVTRFIEVREAQALRGHKVRRVGDLVPLVIPLLAGGMERSMNLAEAMEARGFSRNTSVRRVPPILVQGGLVVGLGLVLAGGTFLTFFPAVPMLGWAVIVAGLGMIGLTLWAVGAGSSRTRYRRSVWRERDTLPAVLAAGITAILLVYRLLSPLALVYDPLSTLRIYAPPFDLVPALALAALATPAFLLRGPRKEVGRQVELESRGKLHA